MKKWWLMFGILILVSLVVPIVYAGDITLKTNQTEYWYRVNENAFLPLEIESTYNKPVSGMFTTSVSQRMDKEGSRYSSERVESRTFEIYPGKSLVNMGFGMATTPILVKVSIKFSYDEFDITLNDVIIHYVADDEQKQDNNQENSVSSEKLQQEKTAQELKEKFQEMFSPQQQKPQEPTQEQQLQNNLQNNQMQQDSGALKKQLEQEMQAQEQLKQEMQNKLANERQFQEMHEELLDKGYQLKNAEINPIDNETADFKLEYERNDGSKGEINGKIENNQISEIGKLDNEDKQKMLNELKNNQDFLDYKYQLEKEDYLNNNVDFTMKGNETAVTLSYNNPENQTANIVANYVNHKIKKVELEKDKNYFSSILFLFAILGIGYYLYTKYFVKKDEIVSGDGFIMQENPFDYVFEAKKLLSDAKADFEKQMYKNAYGKAGQSLRLYLSYKNGLNKEITNDDIVRYMMFKKKEYKPYKECFDLCSMVEFAKYQPNSEDFGKITNFVNKTVK